MRARPRRDFQLRTPGGDHESRLGMGDVVRRLRARRAEIERAIFARIRDVVPDPVGLADAEYVAGLRAAVAAAVDYGLTGIERAGDHAEPIPSAAVVQARRAARSGVSLDAVLRRYTAGYALLEDFLVEEIERGETPEQRGGLRLALRAHAAVLERLTASVAQEYGQELVRAGRSPEGRRLEVVRRLLGGEAAAGAKLGYELDGEHLGVIARGAAAREVVRELATRLDRRLLSVAHGEGTVWAWLGGQHGLAVCDLERVLAEMGSPAAVSLAVGEPARGLAGWRLTHHQAQAALVVALRQPRDLTRYGDVALRAATLTDELLGRSLIDIYLSPLKASRDGGAVLRQTLRAYVAAERNASSAAAALKVVRATVENRLHTVERLLGRSLGTWMAELEVALWLDALEDSEGQAGSSSTGDFT